MKKFIIKMFSRKMIPIPVEIEKLENGYLLGRTFYRTLDEVQVELFKELKDYFNDK